MKKRLFTIIIVVVLTFALMASASAASFTHLADELNALGLFRGSDTGYDLESAPNRGQALVMLIRLYGLEDEALECESENPFSDVSGWLVPYVAFAFENGFTTGTSETTFSPNDLCTAQMYVTYVLRALGYSSEEGGDFTYAEAIEFAMSIKIIDTLISEGEFLRDQMVAVSYLALLTAPKGGEYVTLLDKLVDDGAVDEAIADVVISKLAMYSEYMAIGAGIDSNSIAMIMKAFIDFGMVGKITAEMDASVIVGNDMDDTICAANVDIDIAVMLTRKMSVKMYIADGMFYIDQDGNKTKRDAGIEDVDNILSIAEIVTVLPLYIYSEITKDVKDGQTVYALKVAESFVDSMMSELLAMQAEADAEADAGAFDLSMLGIGGMGLDDLNLSFKEPVINYITDSDGVLKKITIEANGSMQVEVLGIKIPNNIKLTVEMEITAMGDDVTVNLPDDLDTYVYSNEVISDSEDLPEED